MRYLTLLLLISAIFAANAVEYNISATLKDKDGEKYYMTDYFRNGLVIDSATVADGKLIFRGNYDRGACVRIDRAESYCNCILEDTAVVLDFNRHYPLSGGRLSEKFAGYMQELETLDKYLRSSTDSLKKEYTDPKLFQEEFKKFYDREFDKYMARNLALLKENADNGLGEFLLLDNYRYVDPEEWTELFASLPKSLAELPRSKRLNEVKRRELLTTPGHMFIDLDAKNPDGTPARLSDYVGKGKFVLVDFWASWCGPCRQEGRETLKPLYERYKDNDRIMFLGVATWDDDAKTLKAIAEEGYQWPQLIGAGQEPMKKYGFDGIPMIMLFAPDGTLIARDIRGQEITSAIEKALSE